MRGKEIRFGVVALVVVAGCTLTGGLMDNARVGRTAPDTEGVDADGQRFSLSEYSGRVIMLSFWGNFCGPCRRLFPHEKAIVEKYSDKPFVLLGVNGDPEETVCKAAQLENSLTWRSWWDGGSGPIAQKWSIQYFPTVILIDKSGVIRYRSVGPPAGNELEAKIDELLKEPSPEAKKI
jgi:thiol-disulfide isomerase/thioredoxin